MIRIILSRTVYVFLSLMSYFSTAGVWELMGGRMGMAICNDRRWPETYRVMGLQVP